MFEINLLANGGMMPFPNRLLTSMCLRYNGYSVLIDCGEGTQIALRNKGLTAKSIDLMLITHFHGDHTIGIPGMLLLAANQDKTTPLTIVGPKGITDIVNGLLVVAPHLPFEIHCIELNEKQESFTFNDLEINAFKVKHSTECYGYSISLARAGKFDVEKALALNLEKKYWKVLQSGEKVIIDDKEYTPDMVLGPKRKGLKVTYVTDSRPTKSIEENAVDSDLFICEGMYGDNSMIDSAKDKKHMTFIEAATLAKNANVKELWLTHYSPSLTNPEEYLPETRKIFANTQAFLDGGKVDLNFA